MIFEIAELKGPFHGAIDATTPTGSRSTAADVVWPRRSSVVGSVRATSRKYRPVDSPAGITMPDIDTGRPICSVTSLPISSSFGSRRSRPRARVSVRSATPAPRQVPSSNDRRAAVAAACTSSAPASGDTSDDLLGRGRHDADLPLRDRLPPLPSYQNSILVYHCAPLCVVAADGRVRDYRFR